MHVFDITLKCIDKVYGEERMTNDDNLESNLLTSSLLKYIWFTCWYMMN